MQVSSYCTFALLSSFVGNLHSQSQLKLLDSLRVKIDDYFEEFIADPSFNQSGLKFEVGHLFQEYKDFVAELYIEEQRPFSNGIFDGPVELPEEFLTIPAPFPAFLQLFTSSDSRHIKALSMEVNDDPQNTELMKLVLREYDETEGLWILNDSVLVRKGLQSEIKNIDGITFVFVLAHNNNGKQCINIYKISDSKFILSQTLKIGKIDHFAVWDEPNSNIIYLGAIANFYGNQTCSLYLYQKANANFAVFDIIPTLCGSTIKPFSVNFTIFLAVCHPSIASDKNGMANHTVLYKFNAERQLYDIHQSIPISGCMNVEYFKFKSSKRLKLDHFLVLVSSDEQELNSSLSVIYKLHKEYFYPFQVITLKDIQQWLVFESKGQLLLFAATTYSGINVLTYDEHNFFKIGAFQEPSFISSISKFLLDDIPTLVIADRENDGTRPNVFQIPFKNENALEEIEGTFNEWHSEIVRQFKSISQLEYLEEKLLSAPRTDSPKITVNGTLEFSFIESDQLLLIQPFQDSLNDSREEKFVEDLGSKLVELKMVENFVHKLVNGNGKFVVNGDLFLNDFVVNCSEECDLNILSITNLNGEDFDELVANLVNIHTPSNFNSSLDFENIAISLHLLPEFINDHSVRSLVHQKKDVLFRSGLKLNSILISKQMNVDGLIDGVKLEPDSILLVSDHQA